MAIKKLPDAAYLRKRLSYNPETGTLFWKPTGIRRWDSRWSGKPALNCIHTAWGYRVGRIDDVAFRAHRIIWKWMTGEDPDQIDHINGDRADNRWSNLRSATPQENSQNTARPSDNTSGCIGVAKSRTRWRAFINGKHLGVFPTFEEAARVRRSAERDLGFHPNHGRD